jgi:hypothetical protein
MVDSSITSEYELSTLLTDLGNENGLIRQQARLGLMHFGKKSIPVLLEALKSQNVHTRWEAVKALGDFRDPENAVALTSMLTDDDPGVRWVAMESLLQLGRACLRPVLESFVKNFNSSLLLEGVHHVLRVLEHRRLLNQRERILFKLLNKSVVPPGFGLSSEAAWAAEKVLEEFDREGES